MGRMQRAWQARRHAAAWFIQVWSSIKRWCAERRQRGWTWSHTGLVTYVGLPIPHHDVHTTGDWSAMRRTRGRQTEQRPMRSKKTHTHASRIHTDPRCASVIDHPWKEWILSSRQRKSQARHARRGGLRPPGPVDSKQQERCRRAARAGGGGEACMRAGGREPRWLGGRMAAAVVLLHAPEWGETVTDTVEYMD